MASVTKHDDAWERGLSNEIGAFELSYILVLAYRHKYKILVNDKIINDGVRVFYYITKTNVTHGA